MLSYAEHGKFRAQTQGQPSRLPLTHAARKQNGSKLSASALCGSVFRNVPAREWTTPHAQAQWACPKISL
jgi:hypothetical protein